MAKRIIQALALGAILFGLSAGVAYLVAKTQYEPPTQAYCKLINCADLTREKHEGLVVGFPFAMAQSDTGSIRPGFVVVSENPTLAFGWLGILLNLLVCVGVAGVAVAIYTKVRRDPYTQN